MDLDRVSGLHVLFGHQSVGGNIVDGLRALTATGAPAWPVIEASAIRGRQEGWFACCRIGRNGDPISKTRQFVDLVAGPDGQHLDLAFHKYCYADIDASSDVRALFAEYRTAMRAAAAAHRGITFAHVTVPLVRVRTGMRALAHRVLGRTSPRVVDNANREAFNDLLRREYTGREPLFDLADLEARPSGSRAPAGPPRSLRSEYTSDGGHLNETGRAYVAGALIAFIAGVPGTTVRHSHS
ncbi:MAG TPA: hypothetical protein VFJ02_06625 [Vicinamibacterales bacterium]|nr:hypothetical protein [Vicinamibacterales bacterium]